MEVNSVDSPQLPSLDLEQKSWGEVGGVMVSLLIHPLAFFTLPWSPPPPHSLIVSAAGPQSKNMTPPLVVEVNPT